MSRSLKKGPFVQPVLLKRIQAMNEAGEKKIVKTWSRSSMIFPDFVGHTIAVHDAASMCRCISPRTWWDDKLGEFGPHTDPLRATAGAKTSNVRERREEAMEAKATLNYTRISPRKVGIVLDLIRNKPVDLAAAILKHTPKAACEDLEKLLKSAVANAENNFNMDRNSLYVSQCYVTPGPILKRIRPSAHGRAFRVLKRTSHITIVVKEKEA